MDVLIRCVRLTAPEEIYAHSLQNHYKTSEILLHVIYLYKSYFCLFAKAAGFIYYFFIIIYSLLVVFANNKVKQTNKHTKTTLF